MLIRALRQQQPKAEFSGLGGDQMVAAGAQLFRHYRDMAFMGVVAVLKNMDKVRENFRIAREALLNEKPDVLILIDYPSFNLKMAKFCHQHLPATKIVYYIPPKIWAWKKWRVHQIARLSDEVLGIFPFEPDFYKQYGYRCTYVGNPTADGIREWSTSHPAPQREKIIAVLPGSRMSEIRHCLPTMLEAARRIKGYRIVVAKAPAIDARVYEDYVREEDWTDDTYSLLQRAETAIVNSGTATLESALLGCPQTAVYHVAAAHLLKHIYPLIFSIRQFTLVNIIALRSGYLKEETTIPFSGIIEEKIGPFFTADLIEADVRRILSDEAYKKNMLAGYEHIQLLLGDTPAAQNAAEIIAHL